MEIPNQPRRILKILNMEGFEAYIAGGAVRDILLKRKPKDWDIATSATPEQIKNLFPFSNQVESRSGVPTVIVDGIEVATFRKEVGKRNDLKAIIAGSLEEDASRRDFTINAMYMDIQGNIHDPTGLGREHLRHRMVRCVGDPAQRMSEDPTRLFRFCRFSGDFMQDPDCLCNEHHFKIRHFCLSNPEIPATEQIQRELLKILNLGPSECVYAFRMMHATKLLKTVMPEIDGMFGIMQNKWHREGCVFTHTMLVLQHLPYTAKDATRMAALLHDIGKPPTQKQKFCKVTGEKLTNQYSFHGHAKVGAQMSDDLLRRLGFPNKFREDVVWLVANHMRAHNILDMSKNKKATLYRDPRFVDLLHLLEADNMGRIPVENRQHHDVGKAWIMFLAQDVQPKQIGIDGNLIMNHFEIESGPEVGFLKKMSNDILIENPLMTKEEVLKEMEKRYAGV